MKGRIILVASIFIVLLILFIIVMSIFGQAGKAQNQSYLEIAQRQTEIIRLSTIADQKTKTPETLAYAATVRTTFITSQSDMKTVLGSHGVSQKSLTKQLSASKNTKSDDALSEAEKNNRFDETWTELINTEIANYQKQLSAAFDAASATDRKTLENAYNQAVTLKGTTKSSYLDTRL